MGVLYMLFQGLLCHLYIISLVSTLNFCQWNLYLISVGINLQSHHCYNWPTYWFFRDITVYCYQVLLKNFKNKQNLFVLLSPHLPLLRNPEARASSSPTWACASPEDSILKNYLYLSFSHLSLSPASLEREKKSLRSPCMKRNIGWVIQEDNLIYLLVTQLGYY